jgi:threonine synthase
MPSLMTGLICTSCGERRPAHRLVNTCPSCGKVLAPEYNLSLAAQRMTRAVLGERPFDMWRYEEILPVQDPANIPKLGEGGTPLHHVPRLGADFGFDRLLIKDEGLNPTASFKARGLVMAVARAKELGATTIAIPSAGNAASAMAAYAARAGLEAIVAMPRDTPMPMQAECSAYGARLLLVDGLINDAGTVVRAGAAAFGWFDVSTLKEPYRAEGKKTLGLEIAEQLGWRLPDAIIYPTGGGTGIVGMWKAFAELEAIGFIDSRRPRMIVVQAEGCAPIVRAFQQGERHAKLWENASTSAPGLRVPVAIGDYLILDAVRASGGTAVTVSEAELRRGMALAARCEGLFVSPESGAAIIAAKKLRSEGVLRVDEETVVFSTGAGIKHVDMVDVDAPILDPRSPNLPRDIETALSR